MANRSENIADLTAALSKAQAEMKPARFNRQNPHFRNRYADLTSVFESVREAFGANGLSHTQQTEIRDGRHVLVTTIWHITGQYISSEYLLPETSKPQEAGSTLTYTKRYQFCALAGVSADEDDDGEAASKGNGSVFEETGELVSKPQIEALEAALSERGMPKERLIKWVAVLFRGRYEINDLGDIPANAYEKCLKTIQQAA